MEPKAERPTKLVRLEPRRFLLIVEPGLYRGDQLEQLQLEWMRTWPDCQLKIMAVDEYHDASGERIDVIRPEDLRT